MAIDYIGSKPLVMVNGKVVGSDFKLEAGSYSFEATDEAKTGMITSPRSRHSRHYFSKSSSWQIEIDFDVTEYGNVDIKALAIDFQHRVPSAYTYDAIADTEPRVVCEDKTKQELNTKDLSGADFDGRFLTLKFKGKYPIHKVVLDTEKETVFFDGSIFFNWNRADRTIEGELVEVVAE